MNAAIVVLRSAVTALKHVDKMWRLVHIYTSERRCLFSDTPIYPTHSSKQSFFHQILSLGLCSADKIMHTGFQTAHGTVDTFPVTQCKHTPLLW